MKTLNLMAKGEACIDSIDIREEDIDMEFLKNIKIRELQDASMSLMTIRGSGEFAGKAIYLSNYYNYIIGKDSEGMIILVPLKKKIDCCK